MACVGRLLGLVCQEVAKIAFDAGAWRFDSWHLHAFAHRFTIRYVYHMFKDFIDICCMLIRASQWDFQRPVAPGKQPRKPLPRSQ